MLIPKRFRSPHRTLRRSKPVALVVRCSLHGPPVLANVGGEGDPRYLDYMIKNGGDDSELVRSAEHLYSAMQLSCRRKMAKKSFGRAATLGDGRICPRYLRRCPLTIPLAINTLPNIRRWRPIASIQGRMVMEERFARCCGLRNA